MIAELGLKRDEVDLAQPTRDWSDEFSRERFLLEQALGALACRIEHVGSTAVAALPAKPIIDIAICVDKDAFISRVVTRLEDVGYLYYGDAAFPGGHLFVRESSPGVRTHHVHVVRADDPQWRSWLRFRDFLRTDGELRERYARLKKELKCRFPCDRRAYTLAKSRFIESALKRDS